MGRGFPASVALLFLPALFGVVTCSPDREATRPQGTPHTSHWTRHTIDNTSLGADGVRSADVNGDGLPDLVVGWEQGGIARAYLKQRHTDGPPSWKAVTVGPAPDVEDALFFDMNGDMNGDADGDGTFDVISSTEGETRKILVHWAPRGARDYLDGSKWKTETLFSDGSRWMFAVPLEGDPHRGPDLVVGGKDDGAKIGLLERPAGSGSGSGPRQTSEWRFQKLSDAGWIMSLISEDMDDDGDQDILLSDRRGGLAGVRWLENPGVRSRAARETPWQNHFIGAQGREVMLIAAYDFHGDGVKEIVAPHYKNDDWRLSIFKADTASGGNPPSWKEYPVPYPTIAGRPKSAAVGDLDLDGRPDIVLATGQAHGERRGIVWLRYKDSPFGGAWDVYDVSGPQGNKFDLSLLQDVDGDGDLDIINTEENDNAAGGRAGLGVVWYENPLR